MQTPKKTNPIQLQQNFWSSELKFKSSVLTFLYLGKLKKNLQGKINYQSSKKATMAIIVPVESIY